MLKKVFLGLLVIILLLGIGSLFISNIHHIERSTYINASPKVIFNELNNLSSWEKWNTWLQMDTTMKISYNNIKSGVGSEILWSSANQNVGNGTMTITKSEPDKTVETELNFNGKGKGINGFKLEPAGDSTKLTTYFTSDMGWNPVFKYLSLMSKKAMIEMTDNGLKSIKDYIEQMMLSATPDTKIDLVEMKESVPYLAVHAIASADKISGIFESANKTFERRNQQTKTGSE
ncbi:MAG: polyketide cyclase/dehydrase [Bacteroidetes bacterium OLB10]|nr:MAG: polyketide cyclase/dehydrase [Bacteroidetes bacterium OLB10]